VLYREDDRSHPILIREKPDTTTGDQTTYITFYYDEMCWPYLIRENAYGKTYYYYDTIPIDENGATFDEHSDEMFAMARWFHDTELYDITDNEYESHMQVRSNR
jgi:hypothetical protein